MTYISNTRWYSSSSTTSTYGEYISWGSKHTVKRIKKAKVKEKEEATLKKIEPVYFNPKDLCL